MSLSSLSKQLKFGGPDQCRSCSGHLCGSAFRPLKGKSCPACMDGTTPCYTENQYPNCKMHFIYTITAKNV